jgi:hypothetical protein
MFCHGARFKLLHFFITLHVHTQSNRVCNFHVILLFLRIFPPDIITTERIYKCKSITDAVAGLCSGKFSVAYCRYPEGKLPPPTPSVGSFNSCHTY